MANGAIIKMFILSLGEFFTDVNIHFAPDFSFILDKSF